MLGWLVRSSLADLAGLMDNRIRERRATRSRNQSDLGDALGGSRQTINATAE